MTSALTRTLGQEIKRRRLGESIPLRRLAKQVDISAAHMSDIENGKRFPSPELLAKIAKELKVDIEELKGFDARIDPDVRRWAEGHPVVGAMLRVIKESGQNPDLLAKKIIDQVKGDNPRTKDGDS